MKTYDASSFLDLLDAMTAPSPDASFLSDHGDNESYEVGDEVSVVDFLLGHALNVIVTDEYFIEEDDYLDMVDAFEDEVYLTEDEESELDKLLGGDLEMDGSETPVDTMVDWYTHVMTSGF